MSRSETQPAATHLLLSATSEFSSDWQAETDPALAMRLRFGHTLPARRVWLVALHEPRWRCAETGVRVERRHGVLELLLPVCVCAPGADEPQPIAEAICGCSK